MAQRASEGTGLESFFLVPALLLKAPGCPAEQMLLRGTVCETALKGALAGPAMLRCRDWITVRNVTTISSKLLLGVTQCQVLRRGQQS